MINRTVLVGRITKDPDLRKTTLGASVVSFVLACNRRVKQDGQPDADFISCVAWNKTADFMSQYVKKGTLLGVEGRIQTRNYDDKNGKRVYITEVVAESVQFLESKKDVANNTGAKKGDNAYRHDNANKTNEQDNDVHSAEDVASYHDYNALDIASDDLPF